jgi:hypothetical protein
MLKNANGELVAVEWEDALIAVSKAIKAAGRNVAAIAGGLVDAEVTEGDLFLHTGCPRSDCSLPCGSVCACSMHIPILICCHISPLSFVVYHSTRHAHTELCCKQAEVQ